MLCNRPSRPHYRGSPHNTILNAKEIDMRKLSWAVALALFLVATQKPLSAQVTPKAFTLSEKATVLGKLPEKDTRAMSISNDYSRIAFLNQKGDKYVVTLDGVASKEYEWIVARSLTFSMVRNRIAYF